MTWEEQQYKINRIIQLLVEISWYKDKLANVKLTKKNTVEYQYRIRHRDLQIAFYNLDLEGPRSYKDIKKEMKLCQKN